jgi:hypothetical protein
MATHNKNEKKSKAATKQSPRKVVKLSASRRAKGKSAAEIEDWQFGQLRRERGLIDVPRLRRWESYNGEVEWKPGLKIKLEIYTNGTEPTTVIERARNIFNTLRDREAEFLRLAAEEALETFNDILNDKEAEPVDIRTFIDGVTLLNLYIDPEGESMLTYSTLDYPSLEITVSPAFALKDASIDCEFVKP